MKHTPGPWATRDAGHGVSVTPNVAWLGNTSSHSDAETRANASLIAAAPDLLAALLEALEFAEDQEDVIDGPDGVPQANDAMRLAETLRAVIAKATGETP